MKIVELLTGINMPLNNEQADLLGRFTHESKVNKRSLDLREQEIANQLTQRDVLLRRNEDGQIYYYKKIK
jgi:hypothetical protein